MIAPNTKQAKQPYRVTKHMTHKKRILDVQPKRYEMEVLNAVLMHPNNAVDYRLIFSFIPHIFTTIL